MMPEVAALDPPKPRRPNGSGSIKFRGRIAHIGYMHNGVQLWESTRQTSRSVAEKKLREKLRTADTAAHITLQTSKVSYDDVAAVLLAEGRRKKLRSLKDVVRRVAQLREVFAGPWLAITTKRVNDYKDECAARGEKVATTNRRLGELRHMGKLAMRQTPPLVTSVPYVYLDNEADNVRQGFLDPADFKAFVAELRERDEPDVADGAEWAYHSAWRREMVFGAMWKHCELELSDDGETILSARIRLPGENVKNKRSHGIPVTGRLRDVLRRRWAMRRIPQCPFIFHRDGKRIRTFKTAWDKAAETIGADGLWFHDLKRSAARNMRRTKKASETVIMKAAGWRTASMFRRYDIVDDDDVAELFEATEEFVVEREKRARKLAALPKRKAG